MMSVESRSDRHCLTQFENRDGFDALIAVSICRHEFLLWRTRFPANYNVFEVEKCAGIVLIVASKCLLPPI